MIDRPKRRRVLEWDSLACVGLAIVVMLGLSAIPLWKFEHRASADVAIDPIAIAARDPVPPPAEEHEHPLAKYAPELGYSIEPYGLAKWDNGLRLSRWVLHEINEASIKGNADRSEFDFFADPSIDPLWRTHPAWFVTSETHDDKGHYAPCADFKHSKTVMRACMSLKNIMLQNSDLNRFEWEHMEESIRAATAGANSVKILTGPAWKSDGQTIVKTRVIHGMLEPTHCFKAILIERDDSRECLAWLARNSSNAGKFDSWRLPTADLEVDVGFRLWPNLKPEEAKRLKSRR